MKKAGGIVALVAGIFGVFPAVITLLFGGLGSALEAEGADTLIGFGWGGLLFSFLTIVLGAVAVGVERKIVGVLIVVSSLAGAMLGGTFVAICMALALVGGILIIFAPKVKSSKNSSSSEGKQSL